MHLLSRGEISLERGLQTREVALEAIAQRDELFDEGADDRLRIDVTGTLAVA